MTARTGGKVSVWNIANVLTLTRALLVPVFIILLLEGSVVYRWGALIVFCLAAFTDHLDGSLARSRGLITNFGKIADPIADKALVLSAFVVLWLEGSLPWWVAVVILIREVSITLLRFAVMSKVVIAASDGGKIKTVLQMLLIVVLLVPWNAFYEFLPVWITGLTWALVGIVVTITVVTGIQYLVGASVAVGRANEEKARREDDLARKNRLNRRGRRVDVPESLFRGS